MFLRSIEARAIADVRPGSFIAYYLSEQVFFALVTQGEQGKYVLQLKELPATMQDTNLYREAHFRGFSLLAFPNASVKVDFDAAPLNPTRAQGHYAVICEDQVLLRGGNDFANQHFSTSTGQPFDINGKSVFYAMSWKLVTPGVDVEHETLFHV